MNCVQLLIKWTYILGWITAAMAISFRAFVMFGGSRVAASMRHSNVEPRNLLQLSVLFFLMCIASYAYAATFLKGEEPTLKAKAQAAS